MKRKKTLLYIIILLSGLSSFLFAQGEFGTSTAIDTFSVSLSNHYELSQLSIIPFSEQIKINNKILPANQYNIFYSGLYFSLENNSTLSSKDTIVISYKYLRLSLKKVYQKHQMVLKVNEASGDTTKVLLQPEEPFSVESIFGSSLQKSGTLVRGFTVGTNKDFTLNSGLRLQLSGRLSDDIEIVAALTDENTPIQPEGNTERLDELDKVFIQIKHPNMIATFGDFDLQKSYGEFGIINRKLQGLMGEFNLGSNNSYFAFAGARGKFNTNSFFGQDGSQGPYRLTGKNNERNIVIIAGSEKVYLDGILMVRGERNDYVIDYSTAQIIFTSTRLITSFSRISVDFEYTDRKFSRNIFSLGNSSNFFDNKLKLGFEYFREADNENAPIDIIISESDRKILQSAGDDRNKASKSGISLAKPDSLGRIIGIYRKIDTLINNQPFSYYKYAPGDSNSLYNVSFSFVGDNKGDYISEALGQFKFVGIGQGSYLPIIFLPLPEQNQLGNIFLQYNFSKDILLKMEFAGSDVDKNKFSSIDDNNNFGFATNIVFNLNNQKINFVGAQLGKISFSYRDRFIQDKFSSPERFNPVEFNRYYNISNSEPADETLREIGLNYLPSKKISINSVAGFLRRGESFSSDRFNNTLTINDSDKFHLDYNLDYVKTNSLSLSSSWIRQIGTTNYSLWKFNPGLEFYAEDKKDSENNSDSLIAGSFKYYEFAPFIEMNKITGLNLRIKYSLRDEFSPLNGVMSKESTANTQYYLLSYSNSKIINSSLTVTIRNKNFTKEFLNKGFIDNQSILVRSQSRTNLFDRSLSGSLFYEISTEKSARQQKIFVRVNKGSGNFKFLGDLNNNGIADENEFEPVVFDGDFIQLSLPTDQLFPVINLRLNTRWKFNLNNIINSNNSFSNIVKNFSTETFWRVEENSREQDFKKIYLLHFSSFLNDNTTLSGSNFIQQDLYYNEYSQEFSVRLRFEQKKGLNQFASGTERSFNRERSLRIRFRMTDELSNQTDLINENDNVSASVVSNRRREITGNSISTDFSYRPKANIEVGFKIESGRKEDRFPSSPTIINNNAQTLRINISLAGRGRVRAEFERNELTINSSKNFLPFEITGGKLIGKNYFIRLNFDYNLNSNMQSTVSYDGRSLGGGKLIHTARAEVRAYF